MRKSKVITWLCMIAILCGLLSACGKTETSNEVVDTEVSNLTEETKNTEITPIYEEGTDVFLISNNAYGQEFYDGNLIDMNTLKAKGAKFLTEKEVSLYDQRKVNIGYIKTGVTLTMVTQSDEWSYVYVTDGGYFVRTEDLNNSTSEVDIRVNVDNTDNSSKVDTTYTVTDITEKTMYAKQSVNVRSGPSSDYEKVGSLNTNDEVIVTGESGTGWYQIKYNDGYAYVNAKYLSDTKTEVNTTPSNNGGNTNENENNSGGENIPPTDNIIIEEPEPTYTYTVDEVIAIVRSTLESGGIVYSVDYATSKGLTDFRPDLGMGWGMDWVPMDDPYTYASSMVEGFKYWGFNIYYLEYQSTENGCVVLKTYWGTQW